MSMNMPSISRITLMMKKIMYGLVVIAVISAIAFAGTWCRLST